MTTGLVSGMSLEEAGEAVAQKAIEALEGGAEVGVWTESGNRAVLVGIARRGQAAVTLMIPHEEYDGLKLLSILTGK